MSIVARIQDRLMSYCTHRIRGSSAPSVLEAISAHVNTTSGPVWTRTDLVCDEINERTQGWSS